MIIGPYLMLLIILHKLQNMTKGNFSLKCFLSREKRQPQLIDSTNSRSLRNGGVSTENTCQISTEEIKNDKEEVRQMWCVGTSLAC